MTAPTIYVTLSSLDLGTVPSVTNSVDSNDGGNININITWPSSASDNITCDLQFNDNTQDPFNDEENGDTSFPVSRTDSNSAGEYTLQVKNDATLTTDSYCLTLTIDGNTYSTDPKIRIGND